MRKEGQRRIYCQSRMELIHFAQRWKCSLNNHGFVFCDMHVYIKREWSGQRNMELMTKVLEAHWQYSLGRILWLFTSRFVSQFVIGQFIVSALPSSDTKGMLAIEGEHKNISTWYNILNSWLNHTNFSKCND